MFVDSHQYFGRHCSSFLGRSCQCQQRLIRKHGQNVRVNRFLEDVLRSCATSILSWGAFLPLADFALNNAVHASTGLTPFFVNLAQHPCVSTLLAVGRPTASRDFTLGGDEGDKHRSSAAQGILSANVVSHLIQSEVCCFDVTWRGIPRWLNELRRH